MVTKQKKNTPLLIDEKRRKVNSEEFVSRRRGELVKKDRPKRTMNESISQGT